MAARFCSAPLFFRAYLYCCQIFCLYELHFSCLIYFHNWNVIELVYTLARWTMISIIRSYIIIFETAVVCVGHNRVFVFVFEDSISSISGFFVAFHNLKDDSLPKMIRVIPLLLYVLLYWKHISKLARLRWSVRCIDMQVCDLDICCVL